MRNLAEKLREYSQSFSASCRGVSPRNLAEKKMDCKTLREISQSFLCESSRLRIFVRGVDAKKKKQPFSWAYL